MIINLWSTPRTGSNWYTSYLQNKYSKSVRYYNRIIVFNQFFNTFHLQSYMLENYGDFIYDYEGKACYNHYFISNNKICSKTIYSPRTLSIDQEESYRLNLLDFNNLDYKCFIFHNHVKPMSDKAYLFLKTKASRNIFLYRENLIDQLSSYAIGYYTKNFHQSNLKPYNVYIDEPTLKNLADRIIYWHKLDKTDSEIIKYEDLPFSESINLPKKQNNFDTFSVLRDDTKNTVIHLDNYIRNSI